jgi:hypothetical protein
MVISRKTIPVSPYAFFGCFAVAFAGAMTVAWSQLDNTNGRLVSEIIESMLHSRWSYAIPIPIFFALSGSLVGKWFSDFDESAAIAANFVVLFYSHTVNSSNVTFSSGIFHRRTYIASYFITTARNSGRGSSWTCLLSSGVDDHG